MLARIRKSKDDNDGGFTLIELLVVMIIIGILAAIAIPVFLSQRQKARDTAAKADVSTLGKELATYFVDATTGPALPATTTGIQIVSNRYQINGVDVGKVSGGVKLQSYTTATGVGVTSLDITGMKPTNWCIAVQDLTANQSAGTIYKYSAANGLESGTVCSLVTAP